MNSQRERSNGLQENGIVLILIAILYIFCIENDHVFGTVKPHKLFGRKFIIINFNYIYI